MGFRHMLKSLTLETGALSSDFFLKALNPLLRKYEGGCDKSFPWSMALAVSGGVDSMALAVLCSKLQESTRSHDDLLSQQMRFMAFIIDHQARPGSGEEALRVSYVLRNRNIPSRILKIDWPEGVKPSELSNFETLARTYRYRALGRACLEKGIRHLLTAHHADDQAETVLYRMLEGHRGKGLRGMKEDGAWVDADGIYGLDGSGEIPWRSRRPVSMEIEHGGLRILRPLLNYDKKSLVLTCERFAMPWFEDSTNKDPTITPRNAVRSVYARFSLPLAFSRRRILEVSHRQNLGSKLLHDRLMTLRDSWSRKLNPQVGTFTFRFSSNMFDNILRDDVQFAISEDGRDCMSLSASLQHLNKSPDQFLQLLSILILRDIAESVTCVEHVPSRNLVPVSRIVFPFLYSCQDKSAPAPDAVNVCGVRFERRQPRPLSKDEQSEGSVCEDHEWFVSRIPHSSRPELEISPASELETSESNISLYDRRFWIKAQRFCNKPLYIRPFHPEGMSEFRSRLGKHDGSQLKILLKRLAPGKVRYTLPAVVDGEGNVLALPTLGIEVPGASEMFKCEVRYRQVPEYIRLEWEEANRKRENYVKPSLSTKELRPKEELRKERRYG